MDMLDVAGSRHESVSILPRQSAVHTLTLIGYTPGVLSLPHVRIAAASYNALIEPLAGHSLLIAPAPIGGGEVSNPVSSAGRAAVPV